MSEDTTQDVGKKKRGPKGASKPLTTKDFNKLIELHSFLHQSCAKLL